MTTIGQAIETLSFRTNGRGFIDVTREIGGWLRDRGAGDGVVTLFLRHTSASLTVQENADPDVLRDLADSLDRLAPRDWPYRHDSEGPDDMPAHIRTMLTATSLQVPVQAGRMMLGTWQAIYLVEHRDRPHIREIAIHFMGETGA
mgnify:CR=1 FL=1